MFSAEDSGRVASADTCLEFDGDGVTFAVFTNEAASVIEGAGVVECAKVFFEDSATHNVRDGVDFAGFGEELGGCLVGFATDLLGAGELFHAVGDREVFGQGYEGGVLLGGFADAFACGLEVVCEVAADSKVYEANFQTRHLTVNNKPRGSCHFNGRLELLKLPRSAQCSHGRTTLFSTKNRSV